MGRRDKLAIKRTQLANERTFLSYIRTSIVLFATGITMLKILSGGDKIIVVLSIFFIVLSAVTTIWSFLTFMKNKNSII